MFHQAGFDATIAKALNDDKAWFVNFQVISNDCVAQWKRVVLTF
jgi:hypothetical protein